MSIPFNQIRLNDEMQPKYTHTQTHTHRHTNIYTYICLFFFKSSYIFFYATTLRFVDGFSKGVICVTSGTFDAVYKQKSSSSFKNITPKLSANKLYIYIYICVCVCV